MNSSDTPTGWHDTPNDTPTETPRPGGPVLSLGEAVTATGVSRSTLQRRLRAGELEGATRLPGGGWAIPAVSLIAAGLMARTTAPDPAPAPAAPAGELEALRIELDRARAELRAVQQIAAERAEHVTDLRAALEALSRALPAPAVESATPRPRWWKRR
jgi:hypothetical protein